MRSFAVGMVVVALSLLVGAVLLGGCGGDGGGGDDGVIPDEFVGFWGAVAFDNAGNPMGGNLLEIEEDGDILLQDTGAAGAGVGAAQAGPVLVGRVTNSRGTFEGSVEVDGGVVSFFGDLNTNDTGTGTWTRGFDTGAMQLWRAAWRTARTLNMTVAGPVTGTGTVSVGADGLVSGTVTAGGGDSQVNGVVTGAGHIVAATDGGDTFVLIQGAVTGTGASGTWRTGDGETGTWTATSG
jgi:hypothetical protein